MAGPLLVEPSTLKGRTVAAGIGAFGRWGASWWVGLALPGKVPVEKQGLGKPDWPSLGLLGTGGGTLPPT